MHSEMGPVRQNPIQRTARTAHLSVQYDCAQLQYTIQHRTVLIISPLVLPPDKHYSSDAVYWRGGGDTSHRRSVRSAPSLLQFRRDLKTSLYCLLL